MLELLAAVQLTQAADLTQDTLNLASLCKTERVSGTEVAQSLLTGSTAANSFVWEIGGPGLEARLIQARSGQGPSNCNNARTRSDQNLCAARRALAVGVNLFQDATNSTDQVTPRLERTDGSQIEQARIEAGNPVLENLAFELLTEPERFVLICEAPEPSPPAGGTSGGGNTTATAPVGDFRLAYSRFVVTGDRSDLVEGRLKDRSFATYSFTDNVREDAETWNFNVVLGWSRRYYSRAREASQLERFDVGYFATFRQSGGDLEDPKKEIDEVSFGIALGGRYVRPSGLFSGIHVASADLRALTDLDGDARGVQLTGRYDLPFGHWDGYGRWTSLAGTPVTFNWGVDAVVDAGWIDNPGDTFPTGFNDWRRIGANANLALRWRNPDWAVTPAFRFRYQIRDDLDSSGDADASLFSGAFVLTPGDESHVEMSLEYLTGQDLIKLSETQRWAIRLGYRY